MSWQAFEAVKRHSRTKENERVMMLILADYADENYNAYPSVARLADDANLDRRTVFRILERLKAVGELSVQSGQGRKQTNLYHLNLPKVESRKRWHNCATISEAQKGDFEGQKKVALDVKKGGTATPHRTPYNEPQQQRTQKPLSSLSENIQEKNTVENNVKGNERKGSENGYHLERRGDKQVKSIHSKAVCRKRVIYCRDVLGQEGIRSVEGLTNTLYYEGESDEEITQWLAELAADAEVERAAEENERLQKLARLYVTVARPLAKAILQLQSPSPSLISDASTALNGNEFNSELLRRVLKDEVEGIGGMVGAAQKPLIADYVNAIGDAHAKNQQAVLSGA